MTFKDQILEGIPNQLPEPKPFDTSINHAPKRKAILSDTETKLALKNALRYFDKKHHSTLLPEFKTELEIYGRIYMYRFRPDYKNISFEREAYCNDANLDYLKTRPFMRFLKYLSNHEI